MLALTHPFQVLTSTLALMCLLVAAYGTVERSPWRAWLMPWVMGGLFGTAAVLALHHPIEVTGGVRGDLRSVPVVLAGAYLGWRGALCAAGLALVARVGLGGAGMAVGCLAILVNAAAGLGWARLTRQEGPGAGRHGPRALLGLAALSATHVLPSLLLPAALAREVVTTIWPMLLFLHVAGVMVVGGLLERERALLAGERHLAEQADRDPLTGLLNRRGFEAAVARVRPEFTGSALLLLDLDRFKRVNDLHGHAAGDAVLRAVGERLTRALGAQGVVGRLGGEEMAAFLPSVSCPEAGRVAERLRDAVRGEPFALPCGARLRVTASIGGACCPAAADLGTLILRADRALYHAKSGGRDLCCLEPHPGADAASATVVSLAAAGEAAA